MLKFGLVFFINLIILNCAYEVPKAKIDVFSPKGFEVSIPAEAEDTLFAFHGKLNEEFNGLEAGFWARDIVKKTNGRFIFRDKITPIKLGDTLYYWTYVIHDGLGYREDDGVFKVTKYANTDDVPVEPTKETSKQTTGGKDCSTQSKTFVNDVSLACPGDLIFEEDFNGNELDSGKWKMERRMPDDPDYEFNTYLDKTPALSLDSGIATLKPVKFNQVYGPQAVTKGLDLSTDCTGEFRSLECKRAAHNVYIVPPFITPQFSTKDSFKFRYGKVEIKAKLPSEKWVFPQVFLNPVDHKYGRKDYASGQLRVIQNNGNCYISAGAILHDKEPLRSAKLCSRQCTSNGQWHNEFHTYTMTWLPDTIRFEVDGTEICSIRAGQGLYSTVADGKELPSKDLLQKLGESPLAPFDKNFYLTIGYGVGGINDFHDEQRKPWQNEDPQAMKKFWNKAKKYDWFDDNYKFEIDYVKVYAV